MSKITLLPRPVPSRPAELPVLAVHDLDLTGDEPRILDLTLAERLGFIKPHDIRELINRNKRELQSYGNLWHGATNSTGRGRPGREYHLNEAQALLLCALARTSMAARVRRELITVFMAHRHGTGVVPIHDHGAPVDLTPLAEAVETMRAEQRALRKEIATLRFAIGEAGKVLPCPPRSKASPAQREITLLYGLAAIGRHVGLSARQAKHRCLTGELPVFKMGRTVCSRTVDLDGWLAAASEGGRA